MANYRKGRINEEMTKELSSILREIKDPRIQRNIVNVTASFVTADLKYAKIYYSAIAKNADIKEVQKGHDESAENGAHITELLKKVGESSNDRENN